MKDFRILVVGSSNMDIVLKMDRIPVAGESLTQSDGYEYIPGGKGANAAIAAARLCGSAVFCARLGNDANGKRLLGAYEQENVDTRFIKLDKSAQTGLAAIILEKSGQNRIAVYPGANRSLTPDDIEEAFLSYPDAVLIQFEISPEVVISATEYAKKHNIPVFVDAGPTNKDIDLSKLQNVEVFSPNEREAYDLAKVDLRDTNACLEACIKISAMVKTKYIVLKLSNRGCFIYDGKYCDYLPSYEVKAVDTTAAGDAFTAALTVEYMRCGNIKRACKYANAVGALTVTKLGAMTSLPTSAEVAKFIADKGILI